MASPTDPTDGAQPQAEDASDAGARVTTLGDQRAEQDGVSPAPRRHGIRFGWRLAFRARSGRARGFLRFWPVWEWIKHHLQPVRAIPRAPYGLFLVHRGRYHGKPITLPDGTVVRSGDFVLELHVNNRLVAQLPGGLQLIHQARDDLVALAAWSREPDFPPDVKALYGFSLLSRAAARLGFTLRDRRITLKVRLDRFFLLGLMALYHGEGVERLRQGTTYAHYPQELWLSIGELRTRYGPQPAREAVG